jgi:hypothetical protein
MQLRSIPQEYQNQTKLEDFAGRIKGALEAPKSIKALVPFLEKNNLANEQRELLNQLYQLARLSSIREFDRMLML